MKALVTGGGGFLGSAIARQLVARGDGVRIFARGSYPELAALGIETFRGDLGDGGAVVAAAEGCDIVFHVGAKPGIAGPYEEYYRTNVVGTQNVIEACRRHGIRKLVHTSSPSVIFDGSDMEGVDESVPYPERFHAAYPETKATAERLVLAAAGRKLATVALRPHAIWGPGDNHLVPRIIARAKSGHLARIGRGDKKVDGTYIDNAADAHVLAAERLAPGSPISGKAYFIAQGEPVPLWDLIDRILAAAGLPPVRRTVAPAVAYAAGAVLELAHWALRLKGEPRMTRFLASELSTAHWFDLSAARRDLGYVPKVSMDEGMRRLGEWLRATGDRTPASH